MITMALLILAIAALYRGYLHAFRAACAVEDDDVMEVIDRFHKRSNLWIDVSAGLGIAAVYAWYFLSIDWPLFFAPLWFLP